MQETIAQIIGIFAAALNISSFQCKSKNKLIFIQLFGGLLFAANYLLLGAITGALMNGLAVVRAILFLYKDKLHIKDKLLVGGFILAFLVSYALTFTIFGVEPTAKNFILEALPIIGMSAATISFNMKNAKAVRFMTLILGSPSWLIYNIFVGSLGAILCEAFSIISIIIGIIRHDIKKPKEVKTKA